MTPSEATKQDLETLIGKANDLAKEMGLTLYLDPSNITLQSGDNTHGYYDEGKITLTYDQQGISKPDLIRLLVHEGIHERFEKEIILNCKNPVDSVYVGMLFNEPLAYAVQFFFDAESYAGMLNAGNPSARMSTGCLNPELAYAIAKACKNGMKMDDIFEKVKTIQWPERSPCHPTATMAKFVRDVLGMNLTDVFEKEDADRYESWIAEEASAK
jgi:hypothetical protein